MIAVALQGPLRVAVALLWLVGAVVAGITTVLAMVRIGIAPSLEFAVPAAGLLLLSILTFRGAKWALVIDIVLLAALVIVVGGSLWELGHVDADKASQLRALGIDRSFAVGFQLAFALAGSALLAVVAVRLAPQVSFRSRRDPSE